MENTHYDPLFEKKRKILPLILQDELTARQRLVIQEYYAKKQTTAQIAEKLGITPSAVLRVRQRAEKRIEQCLRYCG